MQVNEAWHRSHPMPAKPTMDQRVEWHTVHAQLCGCRPIPPAVKREMKRRNLV